MLIYYLVNYTLIISYVFVFFFYTLLCVASALDHLLILLLLLDLLLMASIFLFITYSTVFSNYDGYSLSLLVLGVAAADTAVGLGLFIIYYKATGETSIKNN